MEEKPPRPKSLPPAPNLEGETARVEAIKRGKPDRTEKKGKKKRLVERQEGESVSHSLTVGC